METDENSAHKSAEKPSGIRGLLRIYRDIRFTGLIHQLTSIWSGAIGLLGIIFGAFLLTPIGGDMPDMCAFYSGTSLPCPGCGLTRSVTSYFHGEFVMGFLYHPLGVGFAVLFLFTATTLFLPKGLKSKLRGKLLPHEQNIGRFMMIFVMMMFTYGVLRIVFVSREMPGYEWWRRNETPEFALHWVADQQPYSESGQAEFSLIKSSSESGTDN